MFSFVVDCGEKSAICANAECVCFYADYQESEGEEFLADVSTLNTDEVAKLVKQYLKERQTKLTISQSDFYALPEVVAANEVLKRTPRGNVENKAAFEAIVRAMERYDIPEQSRWTLADY